jgi:hypothetical protein
MDASLIEKPPLGKEERPCRLISHIMDEPKFFLVKRNVIYYIVRGRREDGGAAKDL